MIKMVLPALVTVDWTHCFPFHQMGPNGTIWEIHVVLVDGMGDPGVEESGETVLIIKIKIGLIQIELLITAVFPTSGQSRVGPPIKWLVLDRMWWVGWIEGGGERC